LTSLGAPPQARDAVANFAGWEKHGRIGFEAGERISKLCEWQQGSILDFVGDPQNAVDDAMRFSPRFGGH